MLFPHTENYKTLMNKIKELDSQRHMPCNGKLNIIKKSILAISIDTRKS